MDVLKSAYAKKVQNRVKTYFLFRCIRDDASESKAGDS